MNRFDEHAGIALICAVVGIALIAIALIAQNLPSVR